MTRRLFALLAIPAALAIPGHASANSFGADADCQGLRFSLARGEAGTVVEATVDGRRVAIGTVLNQFDPIGFTVPNPDATKPHTWVVTVDSLYNTDQRWTETVGVCSPPVASTTTTLVPASTTTTTLVPASTTTTTVVNPTTSVPTSSVPPTVVTTPRPTTTIPQTSVPPFRLPDTGTKRWLSPKA